MAPCRQRLDLVTFCTDKGLVPLYFAWCPIRQQLIQIRPTKAQKRLIEWILIPRQGYKSYLVGKVAAAAAVFQTSVPKSLITETMRKQVSCTVRTLFELLRNVYRLPIRIEIVRGTGWRVRTDIWKNATTEERRTK